MKLNPEVYLEAARRIAEGQSFFSCTAVSGATNQPHDKCAHRDAYSRLFNPWGPDCSRYERNYGVGMSDDPGRWWLGTGADSEDCRVLALLFMKAIVENGDHE